MYTPSPRPRGIPAKNRRFEGASAWEAPIDQRIVTIGHGELRKNTRPRLRPVSFKSLAMGGQQLRLSWGLQFIWSSCSVGSLTYAKRTRNPSPWSINFCRRKQGLAVRVQRTPAEITKLAPNLQGLVSCFPRRWDNSRGEITLDRKSSRSACRSYRVGLRITVPSTPYRYSYIHE